MPTRNIQTTCPYCGRYGWHARTIKYEGAKAMPTNVSACKKDHRKRVSSNESRTDRQYARNDLTVVNAARVSYGKHT